MSPRPASMRRQRLRLRPGALAEPWLSEEHLRPLAVPAERVAEQLQVPVETVLGCGVDPFIRADGADVYSLRLVRVALGLAPSRLEKSRKRNHRTPEARTGRNERQRAARAERRAG